MFLLDLISPEVIFCNNQKKWKKNTLHARERKKGPIRVLIDNLPSFLAGNFEKNVK